MYIEEHSICCLFLLTPSTNFPESCIQMANLPPPPPPDPQPDWDAVGNALRTLSEQAPLFANALNAVSSQVAVCIYCVKTNPRTPEITPYWNCYEK